MKLTEQYFKDAFEVTGEKDYHRRMAMYKLANKFIFECIDGGDNFMNLCGKLSVVAKIAKSDEKLSAWFAAGEAEAMELVSDILKGEYEI